LNRDPVLGDTGNEMRYVVLHLSVTSFDDGTPAEKSEIIELGAVELSSSRANPGARYATFIRPMGHPRLSELCLKRTAVTQRDADLAQPFYIAFREFMEWLGDDPFLPCGWGEFDKEQLQREAKQHKITLPASFENYINLKAVFSDWKKVPPMGLNSAAKHVELPVPKKGALDGALTLAKIARLTLPLVEAGIIKP
jgi:inhibitor of KinA sporulation pathway (predicted exonuclease)